MGSERLEVEAIASVLAQAREMQGAEENDDGPLSAPTPYIMIT